MPRSTAATAHAKGVPKTYPTVPATTADCTASGHPRAAAAAAAVAGPPTHALDAVRVAHNGNFKTLFNTLPAMRKVNKK